MKVVTSCPGRFHIFNQAQQLLKHNMLHKLITAYPKTIVERKWNIPRQRVDTIWLQGVSGWVTRKLTHIAQGNTRVTISRYMHDSFSRDLARRIPLDADVFIGLSAYSLEALQKAKCMGLKTIVDHGSLHEKEEREMLLQDCELFGFQEYGNWSQSWLLEKQDAEYALADKIFVLSELAKRSMIKHGVDESKIFVNRCGVDLSCFKVGKKKDDVFRIIQCSGITPRKGIHYLIQAFAELGLPRSELLFVGAPPMNAALKRIISNYTRENIKFLGHVPQEQLAGYYQQSSVFILPSLADGFGMVVSQAMACALPAIVTDRVGAAEIIVDGRSGYIVPAQSIDALKEKIVYLYENSEECSAMGEVAAASVADGYTWDNYGDRLAQWLLTESTFSSC